jgi:hypothetical protein
MMNQSLQKMLKSDEHTRKAKEENDGSTGGDLVSEPPKIRFNEK